MSLRRAFLAYTLGRLGLLVLVAVIVWGASGLLGEPVNGLPLLLLALPLQIALTLGLGLLLSGVNVFFRDIAQVLGMVFTGWFYLTPIVYPAAQVPARFRGWIELNPLAALVELYRQAFLGGRVALVPGTAALALVAAVLLFAGFLLFRRLKAAFVDEI